MAAVATQIREVWADNLEYEIGLILDIVDQYPYVAIDTEFPGVILPDNCSNIYDYQTLKWNVDSMHLIQLGLTFLDANGNFPRCTDSGQPVCSWQFNFNEFYPDKYHHFNSRSIDFLKENGFDFDKMHREGIDSAEFGAFFMTSGIVLNSDITFIGFSSAYDYAYLLKLLTGRNLPTSLDEFMLLLKVFFPTIYDLKYMMKPAELHGGLQKLADKLGIVRIGRAHQAGSDSFVTASAFFPLKNYKPFNGYIEKYAGFIHALSS